MDSSTTYTLSATAYTMFAAANATCDMHALHLQMTRPLYACGLMCHIRTVVRTVHTGKVDAGLGIDCMNMLL
jgi:hypothetical protein